MDCRIFIGVVLYNNTQLDIERIAKSLIWQSPKVIKGLTIGLRANDNRSYEHEIAAAIRIFEEVGLDIKVNLSSGGNIGFGAGHNLLVEEALKGNFSLYIGLNPDGMLHHQALEKVVVHLNRVRTRGIYELQQFPQEHPKVYDCFTGETAWCAGACFVINPEYFREIGGFDEKIFMYCEDVDISWRIRFEGGSCLVIPGALFFHDVSDDRDRVDVRIQMMQSGRYLAWKWRCEGFQDIMEQELVRMGIADEARTLPILSGKQVDYEQTEIHKICEFRRLFSFSPTRW